MRILCDSCESAAATLFCAADEAALCAECDTKVHMCNKLASRHVRVGLANPSEVSHCDICENAPGLTICVALEEIRGFCEGFGWLRIKHYSDGDCFTAFFYCEVDGSSLCLQCDMIVHVGGKRMHKRYLLLRQGVEFPGDKMDNIKDLNAQVVEQDETVRVQNEQPGEKQQNLRVSGVKDYSNGDGRSSSKRGNKVIDLNI